MASPRAVVVAARHVGGGVAVTVICPAGGSTGILAAAAGPAPRRAVTRALVLGTPGELSHDMGRHVRALWRARRSSCAAAAHEAAAPWRRSLSSELALCGRLGKRRCYYHARQHIHQMIILQILKKSESNLKCSQHLFLQPIKFSEPNTTYTEK
jgi:hypothetical protein